MAIKLNFAVSLVLLAVAIFVHGSVAQTQHVVGGSIGWTIPSGGASTYTTWASNQTFTQGDTLVFNFSTGAHDVVKVTKAGYDACSGSGNNTIFTITSGPANVNLNETGEQYYICTFGSHCSLGQKLAINVTKKAQASSPSPSPQPSSSSPSPSPATSAPSPSPSSSVGSVTYTVGDKSGWIIPSSASSYQTWASGKSFKVGDILVFNFQKNQHNVAEVTKSNYDSCNSTSPLSISNDSPVRITLNKSGEHYFICAFSGHCAAGQKLSINVSATGATSPATSPAAATPPSTAASPTVNPSSPSPTGVASPPQNSHATTSSLGAAGFFATVIMSFAAALLF